MSALGFILIILYCSHANANFWPKLAAIADGSCLIQNTKLLSLLSLLCNSTQTTVQMRDACYGCFLRAGNILDGPTQLYSLNDCSRLYIQQSNYSNCATDLQGIVDGNRPTPDAGPGNFCFAGYCDFVRCIRRINTQNLISSCYGEALGTRDAPTASLDRIYLYTNITACILAKTRCSQFNPITGELQNLRIGSGLPGVGPKPVVGPTLPPFLNALQISETGDIRVFTFPITTSPVVSEIFCAGPPPMLQSGFGTYLC